MAGDKKPIMPVYYFLGDEEYLKAEAVEAVRSRVVAGPMASLNYSRFTVKEADSAAVLNVASTMPAFAPMRLVVLTGAESLKAADVEAYSEYARKPSPSTCLILVSADKWLSKKNAFHVLMNELGYLRKFEAMNEGAAARWLIDNAKKSGKTLEHDAAVRLVAIAGTRLIGLKQEIDKLLLYAADSASITIRDVEATAVSVNDLNAFDLAHAIAAGNKKAALATVQNLEGEEPIVVLGAVAWQIRKFIEFKALQGKGMDDFKLAGVLKVNKDNFPRYRAIVGKIPESSLLAALVKLKDAGIRLKSSRVPRQMVLSGLVMELC